jgi:carbamoyltransferase
MLICGLKLTHDGCIAVIDANKLLFSIELEKLNNNPRYTAIDDNMTIAAILQQEGISLEDINRFAVDGWGGYDEEALAVQPRLHIGEEHNFLSCKNGASTFRLPIAQYHEKDAGHNVVTPLTFSGLQIAGHNFSYNSYLHVTGHIMSAYCTSPFAAAQQDAYVLIWDGGMYPRLYFVKAGTGEIENLGPLFLMIGNIYTIFSQHFGPFKVSGNFAKDDLSIAGKVMAYIALGEPKKELFPCFDEIYEKYYDKPMGFANVFANKFKQLIQGKGYSDEDVLCSFHTYLETLLKQKLEKKVGRFNRHCTNLCIAGGCALNIKWNSAIRSMPLFKNVYVPPFPNDAGSAIGMACAEMAAITGTWALQWNVYSGPAVTGSTTTPSWDTKDCSVELLAKLLYETKEPVVFINNRAELGPRALGNRSILADATWPGMKDVLNEVKDREAYRPVSPICLEEKAPQIFNPGTPDPFMLFDHLVKEEWLQRIPAVCHLDGTARLQTVNKEENSVMTALLEAYEKLSGIPLLCNTSANYKGSGFFPDVQSAAAWDQVNYIWCDQVLYSRINKRHFTSRYDNMWSQINA